MAVLHNPPGKKKAGGFSFELVNFWILSSKNSSEMADIANVMV